MLKLIYIFVDIFRPFPENEIERISSNNLKKTDQFKRKRDCEDKAKEKLRHRRAGLSVEDKQKLNKTLQIFK